MTFYFRFKFFALKIFQINLLLPVNIYFYYGYWPQMQTITKYFTILWGMGF